MNRPGSAAMHTPGFFLSGIFIMNAKVVSIAALIAAFFVPSVASGGNVECLARVLRSEAGDASDELRLWIAHATLNHAARRNVSVSEWCKPPGRQNARRPVSTRQSATERDLRDAERFIAESDVTGGAWMYFEPGLQQRLCEAGKARCPDEIRRRWRAWGLELFAVIDGWEFYV